jgi:hypothetical protein
MTRERLGAPASSRQTARSAAFLSKPPKPAGRMPALPGAGAAFAAAAGCAVSAGCATAAVRLAFARRADGAAGGFAGWVMGSGGIAGGGFGMGVFYFSARVSGAGMKRTASMDT